MLPVVKVVTLAPTLPDPEIVVKALLVLHWIVYPVSPVTSFQVTVTRSLLPLLAAVAVLIAGAGAMAPIAKVAVFE